MMLKGRKLNILGAEYTVVFDRPEAGEAGISNDCTRLIKVDPTLALDVQVETFYHEVVHQIMRLSGVAHTLDDKTEEAIAQCLGFGLFQFLSNNPGLPVVEKETE